MAYTLTEIFVDGGYTLITRTHYPRFASKYIIPRQIWIGNIKTSWWDGNRTQFSENLASVTIIKSKGNMVHFKTENNRYIKMRKIEFMQRFKKTTETCYPFNRYYGYPIYTENK